jgi:uncharacterized protein (DUF433 family)
MDDIDWREHIVADPNILVGKPTVRGTRLAVEMLLEHLAAGWTEAELFDSYPHLTPEALRAVYAYAAAVVHEDALDPLASTA